MSISLFSSLDFLHITLSYRQTEDPIEDLVSENFLRQRLPFLYLEKECRLMSCMGHCSKDSNNLKIRPTGFQTATCSLCLVICNFKSCALLKLSPISFRLAQVLRFVPLQYFFCYLKQTAALNNEILIFQHN